MNLNKALLIDILYESGRTFVGGISVAFMLSRGISPADVAMLKIAQAIVVFIGEIPTGFLADRFGKKKSLIISAILCALGLTTYLMGHSFAEFIVGEILLALSLCCWSGAYESWAIEVSDLEGNEKAIKEFFHKNTGFNQTGIVVTGAAAGFIVGQSNQYQFAYWAGISSMIALIIALVLSKNDKVAGDVKLGFIVSMKEQFQQTLAIFKNGAGLRNAVLGMVLMQFVVQPMFHYWQPLSMKLYSLNANHLAYLFSFFCAGSAILNFLGRSSRHLSLGPLILIWSLLIAVTGMTILPYVSLIGLSAAQISYSFIAAKLNAKVALESPLTHRASVLSAASFLSRIGMLTSLALISVGFKAGWLTDQATGYLNLFQVWGGLGLAGLAAFYFINKLSKRRRVFVELPLNNVA